MTGTAEQQPAVIAAELIGTFSLTVGGRRIEEWPRPPARRLVQLLLVEPSHRLLRDVLAHELVPDSGSENPRRALSKALSQARQALGRESVIADGHHLGLAGTVRTDLDELRHALREAVGAPPGNGRRLALQRALGRVGTLLPGEPDRGLLAGTRVTFAQLVRSARLALAHECEAESEPEESLEVWEAAFAEDHSDAELAIGLIRACRRFGDDARAVEVYRSCRKALGGISGTGRSSELEQAVEGLLLQDRQRAASVRLLGRRAELGELVAALGSAEDGAGTTMLVTGPAGIGKSALLAAVVAVLRDRGWMTAFAAAGADDDLVPYAALRGALSEVLEEPGEPGRLLPPSIRALLRPSRHRQGLAPARWPVAVLATDLGRLLERVSSHEPLLVVIDDVHRSDPATHELVGRLAARPAGSWSLLLAARSDEPRRPVPRFTPSVRVVDLGPLAEDAASALARAHLDTGGSAPSRVDDLARLVTAWSRGNPLFIVELARQVASGSRISERRLQSVPPRVTDLLEQRLVDCSDAARITLPLLALAHPHTDYALVSELAERVGTAGTAADDVLDELVAAGIVTHVTDGIQLAHPRWREAALSRINPLRLASLHGQIADALDALGRRELLAAGHRIAAYRAAPLVEYAEAAARCGLAAGHSARSFMADDTALQLFGPALVAFEAVPARQRRRLRPAAVRAWLESGHVHADRLDLEAARHAYESALGLAATDEEYAAGYSALGGIAYKHGDFAGAEAIYSRGLRLIRADSAWAQARLRTDIAWAYQRQGRVEEARAGLETAASLFATTRDRTALASCLDLLSVALSASGRAEEALEAAERALAMADRSRDLRLRPTFMAHHGRLLLSSGEAAGAEREAREGVEAAKRAGDRYVESVCHWLLADCLDAMGDLSGALDSLAKEESVLRELGNDVNRARCLAHQASLLWRLGRPPSARRARDEARAAADRLGDAKVRESVEAFLALAGVPTG